MKKIVFVILFISLNIINVAQEETLLKGHIESGGYGGPFCKIGQINGETGVFVGGQGGWIINHQFVIGGKGYGLVNEIKVADATNLKLEFGCGGGLLEYIFTPNKLIHFNIHSMIGAGSVKFKVIDHDQGHSALNYSDDTFFILEPGINIILNVNSFFRIGAGVTYRYISGVEYEGVTNSDLMGLSGQILLKFGKF